MQLAVHSFAPSTGGVSHIFLSPSEAGRDYWERILIRSTLNTSLSSGSTQAFPAFGNVWGRETSATSTWSRWRSNLIQSKLNVIHIRKVKIKCDSMLKGLKFILLPLNPCFLWQTDTVRQCSEDQTLSGSPTHPFFQVSRGTWLDQT